mmetsp:Transcript_65221/g.211175  ORF Transcript_65221/g.211175 Transcript_65221/m.211175 type:complete len:100 (-) Transcript_65221:49-348(-)
MKALLTEQQQRLAAYEAETRSVQQIEEDRDSLSMMCSDGMDRPRLLTRLPSNMGAKFAKIAKFGRKQSKESMDSNDSTGSHTSKNSDRSFAVDLASEFS